MVNDDLNHRSKFASAWEEYRRRRRWFFRAWFGGFVIVASFAVLLEKLSLGALVSWVLVPLWGLAFLVAASRFQNFKCPRCHHAFFGTWWFNKPFARRCVHCGLTKWSVADPHEKNIR